MYEMAKNRAAGKPGEGAKDIEVDRRAKKR